MSLRSDTARPADHGAAVHAPMPETRPMYWSVRREIWENRSIYIAPLAVTALVLLGTLISLGGLPRKMRSIPDDPARLHAMVVKPFTMAPAPIMLATLFVGFFYSLEALYGERRDRSILFWKSLPVSDRTAVLSKAAVPLVVLPSIAFALSVSTFVALLLLGTAVLAASGMSPGTLWAEVQVIEEPLVMLYGLIVHSLWFAPIYGWLLLVSVWARRTPLLWAVLPPFAIAVAERIALGSSHFASLLRHRVTGAMQSAFTAGPGGGALDQLHQLTPLRFLSTPGPWLGLAFAAAFLWAAVRLRREREPI